MTDVPSAEIMLPAARATTVAGGKEEGDAVGTGAGASSSELAQQVRSDFRQARVAVSRALLLHGRGSPEHQRAAEQWALRQSIRYELAVRSNGRPDDIHLSQVADGDILDAARTVRALVAAVDANAEFLAATAFLDTLDD